MQIISYGQTDVGRKRTNNEDYFLVDDEIGLYIVCDGVGGHEHGEVASEEGANTAAEYLRENRQPIDEFEDTPEGRDLLRQTVTKAVQAAGKRVFQLAGAKQGRARMGATMTLLVTVRGKAVMGHVGDSRLYIARSGEVHQLSEDHTYLAELVRRGEIKPEDVEGHPFGNVITRVLGAQEVVQVDTLVFDMLPGDTYLLCSDGLSGYFPHNEHLAPMLEEPDASTITQTLIDAANDAGGKDNVTAIIVRASGEDDACEEETISRTGEMSLEFTALKHVAVFQYLSHKELLQIHHISEQVRLAPGEKAIEEGATGDSLYVIVEGRLAVSKQGTHITYLQGGTHFGEMALLNARPRSASVTAADTSHLVRIPRDRFNDLIRKEPILGVKLLWSFAQVLGLRLDETTGQLYNSVDTSEETVEMPFFPGR